MLIETLDSIAEAYGIPETEHPMLHINPRESWVELVASVLNSGVVKPNRKTVSTLARNWEKVLYNKYSLLN